MQREKDLKAAEAQFNLDLAEAAALLHEEKAEWHEELEERDAQHKDELDALHLKHQQEITDLRARLPSAEPSNGRRPANAVSQTGQSHPTTHFRWKGHKKPSLLALPEIPADEHRRNSQFMPSLTSI